MVTLKDAQVAIQAYNNSIPPGAKPLSTSNPANFFKDFIRHRNSANANWPTHIWRAGYTGRQVTGNNFCFEFIPVKPGQTEPFPSPFRDPDVTTPRHQIENASLPLASRQLGRTDEPWMIQVLVRLRVIERRSPRAGVSRPL